MANIKVIEVKDTAPDDRQVEFVERKGVGHPDSLIDGICDRVSIELSKAYLSACGRILHHNVDKGLIVGGESTATFGTAKITRPIEVIIAGRAVKKFNGTEIPVDQIAKKAAKDYLKENTRYLDLENEVTYDTKIATVSLDLNQVFERSKDVPLANDTSFGIGFAPFTDTERLAYETEKFLNGKEYKEKMPSVGEDVKVMAVREGNRITLTLAVAFVSQEVRDIKHYIELKQKVTEDVRNFAKTMTKKEVEVVVNNADDVSNNEVYLTKSGLSAEAGDDGSVGRGNRVNGVITPFRNMTLEAAAGKNPTSHVGKIYNMLAKEISNDVIKLIPEIRDCRVYIVSQIGRSIDDPKNLTIELIMKPGHTVDEVQTKVNDIARDALSNIAYLTQEIVNGQHPVF